MQVSYSRVSTFKTCPYQYYLRYKEKLKTVFDCDPQNALVLGHALHTGIEKDTEDAVKEYFDAYPVISDLHVDEAIKFRHLIPIVKEILPEGEHEVKIENDDFIGFIDLLAPVEERIVGDEGAWNGVRVPITEEVYDLYDFKYSNNIERYMESGQLHLYKYFFELLNPGKRIRKLYFVFIPKTQIRRKYKNKTNKRDETDAEFRNRIIQELDKKQVIVQEVKYDPNKVIEFLTDTKHVVEAENFDKNQTRLCDWCEYKDYCQKGDDTMILPENKRRTVETINKKVIWLYGAPFSGKTFLANKFPDPLMLNTDGNIRFIDAPYIPIKDVVKVEGRITKRTLAWEVFKEAIAELEKKQNDFKTIVVDLLEDTYEHCRLYMYDQLGITHESDDSFRAWDKVRTEFLSTLKRLMNLDYENIILISHEDTSKDITKKGGDKITSIKPNINDKCANKVAGMVDIVARVVADGSTRTLSFKTNEVIFGGGRLNVKDNEIPLDYDALMEVYEEANKELFHTEPGRTTKPASNDESKPAEEHSETSERNEAPAEEKEEPAKVEETSEEMPRRRRRRAE